MPIFHPPFLIATGKNGTIVTSPDGSTFTSQTSGTTNNLNCACGSLYSGAAMVVGDAGTILLSGPDSPLTPSFTTWTPQTSGVSANLNGCYALNDTLAVIVGDSGTILINASANGTSWASVTSGTTQNLHSVIFDSNNSLWVAVGNSGTIVTSPDGSTWTLQTSGTTQDLLQVNVGGGIGTSSAVVAGRNGTILYTTNGTTWIAA